MSIVWYFVALVVLIALSAFFSASESTAFSMCSRISSSNCTDCVFEM